jgi:hypothetical protein
MQPFSSSSPLRRRKTRRVAYRGARRSQENSRGKSIGIYEYLNLNS